MPVDGSPARPRRRYARAQAGCNRMQPDAARWRLRGIARVRQCSTRRAVWPQPIRGRDPCAYAAPASQPQSVTARSRVVRCNTTACNSSSSADIAREIRAAVESFSLAIAVNEPASTIRTNRRSLFRRSAIFEDPLHLCDAMLAHQSSDRRLLARSDNSTRADSIDKVRPSHEPPQSGSKHDDRPIAPQAILHAMQYVLLHTGSFWGRSSRHIRVASDRNFLPPDSRVLRAIPPTPYPE